MQFPGKNKKKKKGKERKKERTACNKKDNLSELQAFYSFQEDVSVQTVSQFFSTFVFSQLLRHSRLYIHKLAIC